MKDITNIINEVGSTEMMWSTELFYSVIEEIGNNEFEVSFWEDEENWASVLVNKETIAYVWKKYPLVLRSSKVSENLKKILKDYNFICFIEVNSLRGKELKIDSKRLTNLVSFDFDTESFSAEDLWFQTNT